LEQVVGAALTDRFYHCLGGVLYRGGVSPRLTDMPGSSAYLKGSVVCYSNEIKIDVVGVPAATIAARGAVSTETAIAMAEGIRRRFGTTIGVGITGIAGPGGGTDEKPVGLVYIAVAGPNGTVVEEERFSGQRSGIRTRAANAALNLIRCYLKN
jgi:nicotinamide-nucleotide amidase